MWCYRGLRAAATRSLTLAPPQWPAGVTVPATRTLATGDVRQKSKAGRTLTRVPKKALHPHTGEELDLGVTRAERELEQAREIANRERNRRLYRARDRYSSAESEARNLALYGSKEPASKEESREILSRDDEDHLPEGFTLEGLPRFTKVPPWEKNCRELKSLKKHLSHLHKSDDTVILEGKRLISDALEAGLVPSALAFSRVNLLCQVPWTAEARAALERGAGSFQISYRNISAWSELKTSPGIMAAFSRREIEAGVRARTERGGDRLPITVVLDNVRGPDNLGALLRLCACVGCRRVLLLRGCVDAWQPKVVRAAAGAHFRMEVVKDIGWEAMHEHVGTENPQVVLADLSKVCNSESSSSSDSPSPSSSEGLSSSELSARLSRLESVSSSLRFEHLNPDTGERRVQDMSYYDDELLAEYEKLDIVSKRYDRFERYSGNACVVVFGGETEGVSAQARKFAHQHLGEQVFIPLRSGMDSLNVVSAASVVLFEVQKQFVDAGAKEE